MSVVGTFPGIDDNRRNLYRAETNPLDKSTIISIFPVAIDEKKWTLSPGRFILPPGSLLKPSTLVVGPSSWWREIDPEQPLLEIPQSSVLIANSIVNDYCNGMPESDMVSAMPGLFFIPGALTTEQIIKEHQIPLKRANDKQRTWYSALVKRADSLWARSNGNPLAVSDIMRIAARELGLSSKEWLQDFQQVEVIRCVACGSMRNPQYPVCPNCKTVVDVDKARSLGLNLVESIPVDLTPNSVTNPQLPSPSKK